MMKWDLWVWNCCLKDKVGQVRWWWSFGFKGSNGFWFWKFFSSSLLLISFWALRKQYALCRYLSDIVSYSDVESLDCTIVIPTWSFIQTSFLSNLYPKEAVMYFMQCFSIFVCVGTWLIYCFFFLPPVVLNLVCTWLFHYIPITYHQNS